jgi:hypothetical protein
MGDDASPESGDNESMRSAATVEVILARLNELSRERQDLRAQRADEATLELNRLAIVEAQWDLAHALIRRHLPVAA